MKNTYSKIAPHVFAAKTEKQYNKGDTIIMTTRHGNQHECIIHNLIHQKNGFNFYSITRADGFNSQERARRKSEKYESWASSRNKKSDQYHEASNEGREFLRLAEPIKVGHHSEKRHRALIQRNHDRMDKAVENSKVAAKWESKAEYWKSRENDINLSMPESLEFYEFELQKAIDHHKEIKENPEKRSHSMSLQYASRDVRELKKKLALANKLWK